MAYNLISLIKPRTIPPLDDSFQPAVLWNHTFLDGVRNSKKSVPLSIAIKKEDDSISVHKAQIFSDKFNRRVGQSIAAACLPLLKGFRSLILNPGKIF